MYPFLKDVNPRCLVLDSISIYNQSMSIVKERLKQ